MRHSVSGVVEDVVPNIIPLSCDVIQQEFLVSSSSSKAVVESTELQGVPNKYVDQVCLELTYNISNYNNERAYLASSIEAFLHQLAAWRFDTSDSFRPGTGF